MTGLFVDKVTSTYEHALACAYLRISERGLLIDIGKLKALETFLCSEIQLRLDRLSAAWGVTVYLGNFGARKGDLNLNSSDQLLAFLKTKNYKVPKRRNKKDNTEEDSAQQLGFIRLFAQTNDPCIKDLLDISKLKTVLTRYVRAELYDSQYFSQYNVAGTLTGRRGSKKHIFGLGNNAQNWPKYTEFGKRFRECIIARPGKIFFSVDQKQAEDWVVVALSGNTKAYDDMIHGVDRHKKTAAFLFSIPEAQVKKYPERFLGKKFRHANNYKMGKQTASDSLAKDGFAFTPVQCQFLIDKMNEYDPSIRGIFHKYIEECLSNCRMLTTPLGRERYFLGLRPRGENSKIFGEAYAYIPQSSVGDNTGMSVLYLDSVNAPIVQEGHDSIILEIDDNKDCIIEHLDHFKAAFNRRLKFHNGWDIQIPLEAELGYDLRNSVSTETAKDILGIPRQEDDMTPEAVLKAYELVREKRDNAQKTIGSLAGGVS